MHRRTLMATTIGMLIPLAMGCDRAGSTDDGIDEFHFVSSETDDYCEPECETRVVKMCDFLRSEPELVLFARVESTDYVLEPCQERTYNEGHYEQRLAVLDVAVGSYAQDTIDVVRPSPSNGAATEVGDVAIVKLRNLDDAWLRSAVEIELGPDGAASATDVQSDDGGTIYDLPTTVSEFRQQAQMVSSDYVGQCGESTNRVPDDEVRSRLYDRDCPSDPFPEAEDPEDDTALD